MTPWYSTEDAEGNVLDYMVAWCEGYFKMSFEFPNGERSKYCEVEDNGETFSMIRGERFHPSSNWQQAGRIIYREKIDMLYSHHDQKKVSAMVWTPKKFVIVAEDPLVAAMRVYVRSVLGSTFSPPPDVVRKFEGIY